MDGWIALPIWFDPLMADLNNFYKHFYSNHMKAAPDALIVSVYSAGVHWYYIGHIYRVGK